VQEQTGEPKVGKIKKLKAEKKIKGRKKN